MIVVNCCQFYTDVILRQSQSLDLIGSAECKLWYEYVIKTLWKSWFPVLLDMNWSFALNKIVFLPELD